MSKYEHVHGDTVVSGERRTRGSIVREMLNQSCDEVENGILVPFTNPGGVAARTQMTRARQLYEKLCDTMEANAGLGLQGVPVVDIDCLAPIFLKGDPIWAALVAKGDNAEETEQDFLLPIFEDLICQRILFADNDGEIYISIAKKDMPYPPQIKVDDQLFSLEESIRFRAVRRIKGLNIAQFLPLLEATDE
jgi:hypothetical protein